MVSLCIVGSHSASYEAINNWILRTRPSFLDHESIFYIFYEDEDFVKLQLASVLLMPGIIISLS